MTMKFDNALQQGVLIKRYKRFLADIKLPDASAITVHCPNTGSMKNCQEPRSRVWFTNSENGKRKYPCTWQLIEVGDGELVGINTGLANGLVAEAVAADVVTELSGYEHIRKEVKYGSQNSRIDLLLEKSGQEAAETQVTGKQVIGRCYVEIKNLSLGFGDGLGVFPDAVTTRGHKHLQELMEMRAQGHRAVLFFCVQHTGVQRVQPADDIDPRYGELLRQAASAGVEVLAYGVRYDLQESTASVQHRIPVIL